jgi:hypothetical protein
MAPSTGDTPSDDEQDQAQNPGEGAVVDALETDGDHAEPRSESEGHEPEVTDDANQETTDPLILAQLEAPQDEEPTPAPAAPKPATANPPAAPSAAKQPPTKEQSKPTETPASEEDDPTANLPEEDWQKLSHKAKSQFLSQRKAVRRAQQEREAADERARKAAHDYELVEQMRQAQGLSPEDFHNGIAVVGAVNRGDAAALPVLEQSLANLRAKLGVKPPEPPAPAAPAIDADELAALIEEAESGLDFAKLRALAQKAKAAKPAQPPAATPPQVTPTPTPAAAHRAPPSDDVQTTVNGAIADYLVEEGVAAAEVVPYLRSLIQDITKGGREAVPAIQDRLKAVMAAHRARKASAQRPPAKPAAPPLSGSGRPRVAGRPPVTTNADPLKHALPPGRR